tara:strand:+ start:1232 stop:1465 length:234 start_codon:yes stop_codon:yes gene_type:complete
MIRVMFFLAISIAAFYLPFWLWLVPVFLYSVHYFALEMLFLSFLIDVMFVPVGTFTFTLTVFAILLGIELVRPRLYV